jgi:hypothetical protein
MYQLRVQECKRGWQIYFKDEQWSIWTESDGVTIQGRRQIAIRTVKDYKQAKKFARDVAMFERLELIIQNKYGGVLYRRNYRKGLLNVSQRSRNLPD